MVHTLAHGNTGYGESRDVTYAYDLMNRLTNVDDSEIDLFDEAFAYDPQGRITSQRRGANATNTAGGEYDYYTNTNKLKKITAGMSAAVDAERLMNADGNFVYDADGNMTYDASKKMTVSYDYRGLPTEFRKAEANGDSTRLVMAYDGSGSRIMKRRDRKTAGDAAWTLQLATHYTGIGSEIRESGLDGTAKVVVNLPQGLGRYAVASASGPSANTAPSFEWYLKNHLGSTMLVYGTGDGTGSLKAAYDYRAFGEQVDRTLPVDKVTENFTGKELDDETELSNHGARMLDPMLGVWISVDPKRFFPSPYLYTGNGYNPIKFADLNGERPGDRFNTPNEAAEDCLRYYSGISKSENKEYFSFVWKLKDGGYATNTKMFKGSVNGFGEEQIRNALTSFRPMNIISSDQKPLVAGAHTHGGDDSRWKSEEFSEKDYSGFVKPLNLDLFLLTPDNSFQELDPNGNVDMVLPEVDVK